METFYIKTNKGVERYILNTLINPSINEDFINKILNERQPLDWWIKKGWEL